MDTVEVLQVVRTTLKRRGKGVEGDPVRIVTQYWSMDGELLTEVDDWKDNGLLTTQPPAQEDRVGELCEALTAIRGVVLGNGPQGSRVSLVAINELVGFALYGDFTDSKWVQAMKDGEL